MLILNSPDDQLLAPYSSPNGRFLIFARGLLLVQTAPRRIFHLEMAFPLTVSGVERFRRVGCIAIANLFVTDGVINLAPRYLV